MGAWEGPAWRRTARRCSGLRCSAVRAEAEVRSHERCPGHYGMTGGPSRHLLRVTLMCALCPCVLLSCLFVRGGCLAGCGRSSRSVVPSEERLWELVLMCVSQAGDGSSVSSAQPPACEGLAALRSCGIAASGL